MTLGPEDHRFARLLSGRPGLSRPEKEEVLDAVFAGLELDTASERQPQRSGFFGVFLAMVAAGAAILLVSVTAAPPPAENDFTARGRPTGPQLTAVCASTSAPGVCGSGGELLFELADARSWSHVALFAFRDDDTVIWYAPDDEAATSLELVHDGEIVLLPRRVKLGKEHTPGRYDVAAVLSRRPLDRAAVRAAYENPKAHRDVQVVETQVEVR